MKYGKFCAHRGVSKLMPENTLPAFAAALSLGADEIEFDIRFTKDGKLIVCHDDKLNRISDAEGFVYDLTLDEIKRANAGVKEGWVVPLSTPEEIFAQLGGRMTFNIHLKEYGTDGWIVKELSALAEKYNCTDRVYMAGSGREVPHIKKYAPHIPCVYIQLPGNLDYFYEDFLKYECDGVQFWYGQYDKELVDRIHDKGAFCNTFFADDFEGYDMNFEMGIDTILTNRMDLAAAYKRERGF